MTAVTDIPEQQAQRLTAGAQAALIAVIVGALCLALEGIAPWLVKWPTAWELPATEWVGAFLDWFLNGIKPAARLFSDLMAYPMNWANFVLGNTPWPILIGIVTALGWYLGGLPMAALG